MLVANCVEEHAVVTQADRQRLREMIRTLRASVPSEGGPYAGYLAALERRLAQLATVPAEQVDGDVVTMNSQLAVRELHPHAGGEDGRRHVLGREHVLSLTYEADADAFAGKVSVVTPLGAALLGSRVGDVVEWQTLRGPQRLRVERVLYQPEAAGAFDR